MSHGKESPRQKMVGMMYLVLTALLALNVSKSVLDAFVLVDEGMIKTIENFEEKNELVYSTFAAQYQLNKAKVGKYYKIVQEIQKMANEIYDKITELKKEIIITSEGEDTPALHEENGHLEIHGNLIEAKDNADVPAQVMIGDNNDKAGKELKEMYEKYRDFLIESVDNEELKKSLALHLNTDDKKSHGGENVSWERGNFEHLPLIGVLTIMTGLQSNIRNAESDVINYFYSQIDAGSFKFNKLEPVVIPNSNYIIKGNQYEAQVFLAAFDTTQEPKVYVGKVEEYKEDGITKYKMRPGYDSLIIKGGRGIYKKPGNSVNNFPWGGLIKLQKSDGTYITRKFNSEYQVAESNVVVSPTKMNVFYMGVANPVEISVAGIPSDKIFPTITNAQLSKKGGEYSVSPKRPGNCILTVEAEIDGERKRLGQKLFRVKKVPNPIAMVASKTGGPIAKNTLLVQSGVQAVLEDFVFDLEFKVTEFVVSATLKGFVRQELARGNQFSQEQVDLMRNVGRGDKVYIENIKAVGPDGSVRDLPTITFLIK